MLVGIKLLSLAAIICIANSKFIPDTTPAHLPLFVFRSQFHGFSLSAISAQHFLPPPKSCHLLKNSIVHVTGVCELRKCHIDENYLSCHIFKGITLCDCKKGYLFNQCNGQCVRPRHCPKVVEKTVDCNEKPHYVDRVYRPVGVWRADHLQKPMNGENKIKKIPPFESFKNKKDGTHDHSF